VEVIDDEPDEKLLKSVGLETKPDGDDKPVHIYASQYAARKILARVNPGEGRKKTVKGRKKTIKGRNLLFFVHGYNNNMEDVLNRAERFEKNFGVEVVAFSWPANGGGLRGLASYLSNKRDARASTGALERTLKKMSDLLYHLSGEHVKNIRETAEGLYPEDSEKRDRYITTHADQRCPFKISMILHSMGNYLYKKMLQSSVCEGNQLLFDNVILASADTNNENHKEWVDCIKCRNRVYITINERDHALRASRLKAGEEQRARLGQYPYNLYSNRSVYVDFTNVPHIKDSHAYFEKDALENEKVRSFFDSALNGETAEGGLKFDSATNEYRFRR